MVMDMEHWPAIELDRHVYKIMADSQSAIDKVSTPGEQCSAMTQDLLLGINNGGDNSRLNNARHSRLDVCWLVGKVVRM